MPSTVILRRIIRYGPRGRPISLIKRQRTLVDRLVEVQTLIASVQHSDPRNIEKLQRLNKYLAKLQAVYNFYTKIIQKAVRKAKLTKKELACWNRADRRMKLRRKP